MRGKLLKLSDADDQGEKRTQADRRGTREDRRTLTRSAQAARPGAETLTYEQACAKWPERAVWPLPAPVHRIQGLTHSATWADQEPAQADQEHEDQEPNDDADQDDRTEEDIGPAVLLEMVTHELALPKGRAVVQQVIATHPAHGELRLRMVEYESGYLIGVVDKTKRAIGGACEFHASGDAAKTAWAAWLELFGMYRH